MKIAPIVRLCTLNEKPQRTASEHHRKKWKVK